MSKELRIGLLVTISVLVFFAGFYYLKGSSLFSRNHTYYGYYDNVQGLQPSAPVTIKGLQVGRVKSIDLSGDRVRIALEVGRKYALPKGTVAQLYSSDLLGTKAVRLDLGATGERLDDEAVLATAVEGGMLEGLSSEINPVLRNAQLIELHLDSLLVSVNSAFNAATQQRITNTVAALEGSMKNFQSISGALQSRSGALTRTIDNADRVAATLAANRQNIESTMANLNSVSAQLKAAPIEQTARDLQATSAKINALLRDINNGQGTLGLLAKDTALYKNLSSTAAEFSRLAADLKAHPRRYVNLTIFGRRARVGE